MSRNTAPANAGGMPALSREQHLASAYEDLEGIIVDLRGAAAVLEVVEEDTILKHSTMAEEVKQWAGLLPSYDLLILTPGQGEALRYATLQLRLKVEQICERFFAEMDKAPGQLP